MARHDEPGQGGAKIRPNSPHPRDEALARPAEPGGTEPPGPAFKPLIGLTTQTICRSKWYKVVGGLGFKAIEINRCNSKLSFSLYYLDKVKRYLAGLDLSLHSGAAGIFQPHETFTRANLAILTAEIEMCSVLGARQLVFHTADGFLSPTNKKRLKEVLAYAADLGVDMHFESNSILVADYAYDMLDSFPGLGYVLDLGHLNTGRVTGRLGCGVDEFLGQVRDRVVYVHASNNSGQRDEHAGLEEGTLDWRLVLDRLDFSRIKKIIIEARYMDMVEGSRRQLQSYLRGETEPQKLYLVGA